jgi:hypothetical protein
VGARAPDVDSHWCDAGDLLLVLLGDLGSADHSLHPPYGARAPAHLRLSGHPEPTFPRWLAYYNIYAAIGMAPASFMGLFKTGPLAYNGVLAFWVVAVDFFVWMVVMSVAMMKAIANDEQRLQNLPV